MKKVKVIKVREGTISEYRRKRWWHFGIKSFDLIEVLRESQKSKTMFRVELMNSRQRLLKIRFHYYIGIHRYSKQIREAFLRGGEVKGVRVEPFKFDLIGIIKNEYPQIWSYTTCCIKEMCFEPDKKEEQLQLVIDRCRYSYKLQEFVKDIKELLRFIKKGLSENSPNADKGL